MSATGAAAGAGVVNPLMLIATALQVGGMAYQLSESQKAANKAKNASDMQKQDQQNLIDTQKKQDTANTVNQQNSAGASQQGAINAIRAAMTTNGAMGGTILSGPQGASAAPVQSKSLLGV